MRTLPALLFCAALAVAGDVGPELRSWVLAASTNPAIQAIAPDVHAVHSDNDFVYVESAGLSLHSFGSLEANQYDPPLGPRVLSFRIPRHPVAAQGEHMSTPLGIIGAFVTGVPIYNPIGTVSYRDQNIWHQDAVAASKAGTSDLVAALSANSSRHSPIIGFALDGYPIYGPFGWDPAGNVQRMISSYKLRTLVHRTVLPDGTVLTPGQEGPDIGPDFPLGTFAEDYEYLKGAGTLDEYNGRFARTPEYPEGTYAYFLTSWPYLVGPKYAGQMPGMVRPLAPKAVNLITENPKAGQPTTLTLLFRNSRGQAIRFLEKIHQQPIHLIVVSEDLAEFAHIHPEAAPGDVFSVTHTFAHGGHYRLYADYSAPGEPPNVAKFDLMVGGDSVKAEPLCPDRERSRTVDGVQVEFNAPSRLRAGEDIPLRFTLNVRDLEPWLGAWAHIMIVAHDGETFIHAHPLEGTGVEANPLQHVHTAPVAGPSPAVIRTITGFREPGVYKLWFQFQRKGTVVTVPWTIEVVAAEEPVRAVAVTGIKVSGAGFEPARLVIPANTRTQVAFTRADAQNCAREVVFPELGIRKELAVGQTVIVDIPPSKAGDLHFACGMGMYRGVLVVQ
jgi:hypothetical protein